MSARKRGRPRHRNEAKTVSLPVRTTPGLRHQIECAAISNGRSLSMEIETRLYFSFDAETDDHWRKICSAVVGHRKRGGSNGHR